MPIKLAINWNLAHNLFNTGLTFREISDQVGCRPATLRQYAARHNWSQEMSQARQAVSRVVQNMVQKEPLTVQKRAEKWVDATVCDIERTVDTLSKLPIPASLDGIRKHEEVWGMHVKRGRSTFGLDQQGQSVTVNVGMFGLSDVQLAQDPPIDIESSTQSSTAQSEQS